MSDWESYRIVTRVHRKVKALVYTQAKSFVVRTPMGPFAAQVTTYNSFGELELFVRSRGWRLEKVNHFS